jgi:hypothetical protein
LFVFPAREQLDSAWQPEHAGDDDIVTVTDLIPVFSTIPSWLMMAEAP